MFDFKQGRPLTATLVVGAGLASAAFNVFGAYQIYSGPAAWIFAFCILCMEGVAIVALTHIITDFDNNNFLKAGIGALIFAGIVTACAMSGKEAFNNLNIQVRETNQSELAQADRLQETANGYFAAAKATTNPDAKSTQLGYGERMQTRIDQIRIDVEKKRPPQEWVVLLFLAIFELVKSSGRYALAVESKQKWTLRQRKTQKLKEKAKLAAAKQEAKSGDTYPRLAS